MSDNILALHGLIAGLKSSDKQALINIVNAAEANQSTIKTNIATGLNTSTGSTLTSSNTWIDIQNVINNLSNTNKKIKSGTVNSIAAGNSLVISNLTFQPIVVIVNFNSSRLSNYYALTSQVFGETSPHELVLSGLSLVARNFTSNGFTLINPDTSYNVDSIKWYALG